jgi:hypothetical protein
MNANKELNALVIHHIGIVTKNIDSFLMNYPISIHSKIIEDPNQKALITFVNAGTDSLIELVQPLSQESQTFLFSEKGGGYHHICFHISSITELRKIIKKFKMVQITKAMPAIAMGDVDIVFCLTRDKQLIEFVISEAPIFVDWE